MLSSRYHAVYHWLYVFVLSGVIKDMDMLLDGAVSCIFLCVVLVGLLFNKYDKLMGR